MPHCERLISHAIIALYAGLLTAPYRREVGVVALRVARWLREQVVRYFAGFWTRVSRSP